MHKQLAHLLRATAADVADIRNSLNDEDAADYHKKSRTLGDAYTLLLVLANVAEGESLLLAMGTPGDWGYSTPIGKALLAAMKQDDAAQT